MSYLALCIPNYNRIDKLRRLLEETISQILRDSMENEVEICVSDDHSIEDPTNLIEELRERYPQVNFCYERNKVNRGMDYNFLNSVLLAESEYCWIIGNDDLPTEHGIQKAIEQLKDYPVKPDLLVTPFDIYAENGTRRGTIWPLKDMEEQTVFDTSDKEAYKKLLFLVQHSSGLFSFLSNVVFRREKWLEYRERFQDKLDTIFIQMYMNIQTLEDGAIYLYSPQKIIKNYADDEINQSVIRICKILIGLNGVVEYFFGGEIKERLKRVIVDAYISGKIWELSEDDPYKILIREIETEKNKLYKRYFVSLNHRETFFKGKEVVIFGAGNYGEKAFLELQNYDVTVAGVMDSDDTRKGQLFCGHAIGTSREMISICKEKEWTVVVANHFNLQDMVNLLIKNGIEHVAIIT